MNGTISQNCAMLLSVIEPSIQNTISSDANGFGETDSASDVSAPHRLDTATPARISVAVPAPAVSGCSISTAVSEPAIAQSGSASGNVSARPE
jgi:hypothetical protein